jgi:hypothetical protein
MQFHQNLGSWREGLQNHPSGPRAAPPASARIGVEVPFRGCSSAQQTTVTPSLHGGNQEEQLIDHGVARREHGETRRETGKTNRQLNTA